MRPFKTNFNCPENFPYKYKTSCLRNCLNTNNVFFSSKKGHFNSNYQKKTYSFINNINQKKNVLKFDLETNNEKKYYDEDTLICIENCTKTSKNIIKIINVLNLVRNFIIMSNMNVLKIIQELHLNMNQQ